MYIHNTLYIVCHNIDYVVHVWQESIGRLQKLLQLDLRNNCMDVLPAGIGNLSSLVTLYLTNNMLQCLPASIGCLSNLMELQAQWVLYLVCVLNFWNTCNLTHHHNIHRVCNNFGVDKNCPQKPILVKCNYIYSIIICIYMYSNIWDHVILWKFKQYWNVWFAKFIYIRNHQPNFYFLFWKIK